MYSVEDLTALLKKGPCALEGVSESVYHSFFAMSASGLKEFKKAPGYWKYARENPSEDTDARIYGRLVHMAIGEPKRFLDEVIMVEGHRGGKAVKEEIAMYEAAGKTVVKPDQYKAATDIAKYCREHELVSQILKNGTGERSLFWNDPETGVPCKSRLDWTTSSGVIVDFKTFDNVYSEDALEYQIRKMNYHFQAAFYLEAFNRVYGKPPKGFYNVFISKEPIDISVTTISQQSLEETVPHIRQHLKNFSECLAANSWPLTPPEIREIVVKPFFI